MSFYIAIPKIQGSPSAGKRPIRWSINLCLEFGAQNKNMIEWLELASLSSNTWWWHLLGRAQCNSSLSFHTFFKKDFWFWLAFFPLVWLPSAKIRRLVGGTGTKSQRKPRNYWMDWICLWRRASHPDGSRECMRKLKAADEAATTAFFPSFFCCGHSFLFLLLIRSPRKTFSPCKMMALLWRLFILFLPFLNILVRERLPWTQHEQHEYLNHLYNFNFILDNLSAVVGQANVRGLFPDKIHFSKECEFHLAFVCHYRVLPA
jgi:hypothetical protein